MASKDAALRMAFDIDQPFVTQEQKFKYWQESKAHIKTLEAAIYDAVTLPDGWVPVPVEPTEAEYLEHAVQEELLLFASESDYLAIANGVWELFIKRYKSMLQAAPTCEKG